jgi:hypothetical protein
MKQRKSKTVLSVIVIAVIAVSIFFGTREPSVTVKDGQLKISGMHGVTVGTEEIVEIKKVTQDSIPEGSKIFGLDFGNIRKGRYNYGDNNSAKVFLESAKGPYIFVTLKDDIIIINFRKSARTEEVYNYLKETIKK